LTVALTMLHLQWNWSDDHDSDYLATEIELFRRQNDGTWEVANGSGGSDWPSDTPLRRPVVPADYAVFSGIPAPAVKEGREHPRERRESQKMASGKEPVSACRWCRSTSRRAH
jgi:hypothetical protein